MDYSILATLHLLHPHLFAATTTMSVCLLMSQLKRRMYKLQSGEYATSRPNMTDQNFVFGAIKLSRARGTRCDPSSFFKMRGRISSMQRFPAKGRRSGGTHSHSAILSHQLCVITDPPPPPRLSPNISQWHTGPRKRVVCKK